WSVMKSRKLGWDIFYPEIGSARMDAGQCHEVVPFFEIGCDLLRQLGAGNPVRLKPDRQQFLLHFGVVINLLQLDRELVADGVRRTGWRQNAEPVGYDKAGISRRERRHSRQLRRRLRTGDPEGVHLAGLEERQRLRDRTAERGHGP